MSLKRVSTPKDTQDLPDKRASLSSGSLKDKDKIAHAKPVASQRPDVSAQMAVELSQLREDVTLLREERENWLQKESDYQERIRFLESQLYRLLSASSPRSEQEMDISDLVMEYLEFSTNFRNILGKLDSFVDASQKKEEEKKKEEKS